MKNLMLMSVAALGLASCAPMMTPTTSLSFAPQPSAPSGVTPKGNAAISKSDMNTSTNVMMTGLAANTYYVGHYHLQGNANTDPCKSAGAPIMSSKIVGQTDATGALMMNGSVATADIASATYFNVHTAKDAAGTPADDGVACSPLKQQ
jgi:superoxide dismutase, Cu-Zn family